MKAFKLGKKRKRKDIKIEVISKLDPPNKLPRKLFKKSNPPKFEKKFYVD